MLKRFFEKIQALFRPGIEMSYSKINAYKTCPWKYKIVYEDGMHVQPNPFISLGISIHRALEDFHTRGGDSREDLIESYNNSWVNEGFLSPQQTQDFYEKGERMLESYWKSSREAKIEILYLEKEFRFPLGRHHLRGIIDRIDRHPDGTYEVVDYKTHNQIWKQDKVDSDLQLSLYAMACKRALGFVPGKLSYYFLAHNTRMSTRRSDEQIADAARLVGEVARKVIKKDFTPNREHCPKCDFRKSCVHSPEKTNGKTKTECAS